MKRNIIALSIILLFASVNGFSDGHISPSPKNAEVYFLQPLDGQVVQSSFKVIFGLKNMGVSPAGFDKENTGHHHLLIDTDNLPDLSQPLPSTDKIKHFGGGQTEAEITLPPGKHTLQLLLGNYAHVPHDSPVFSDKITIIVE